MKLEWDPKIGPAAIIGTIGSLGILVAGGIAWGSLKGDVQASATMAAEAKVAAKEIADASTKRDIRISTQAERLGKIETSITFIVPALQRIESKLDSVAK